MVEVQNRIVSFAIHSLRTARHRPLAIQCPRPQFIISAATPGQRGSSSPHRAQGASGATYSRPRHFQPHHNAYRIQNRAQYLRVERGVVLLNIRDVLNRDVESAIIPRDEGKVRDSRLAANEPPAVLGLGEHRFEDGEDAERLLLVALDRGGDLLGVEFDEPERLAEVRTARAMRLAGVENGSHR